MRRNKYDVELSAGECAEICLLMIDEWRKEFEKENSFVQFSASFEDWLKYLIRINEKKEKI